MTTWLITTPSGTTKTRGVQGLLDTIDSLDAADIPYWGAAGRDLDEARRVWTIEAEGRRIAFLGVDGVSGTQDYPEQNADVELSSSLRR